MKKRIYVIAILPVVTAVFLLFNIAGGDEGETAGGRNNKEQKTEETHSGGWQLQVMPNMGNRLVRDLYFTDSLTGYAVASPEIGTDSAHILKTTNGGFNWTIKATYAGRLPRIIFLNSNTGFAGGNYLLKTTNAGENWMIWNWGLERIIFDMQVFGEDTIWYADNYPTSGGVYRTTNGGLNWEKRDSGIPANSYPDKLYFYNSRIGFAYQLGNPSTYKTTNGGISWNIIYNGGFAKLEFVDSLKGYRAAGGFHRTTNGGLNWSQDFLPNVMGNYQTSKNISNFFIVNDSIFYLVGASAQSQINFLYRAIIYKSINKGTNWGYQFPDTSFGITAFKIIYSINNYVWCYDDYSNKGIFSTTGGDTTIYLKIKIISEEIPNEYKLEQNYPNPFNSTTKIQFQVTSLQFVKLVVYDLLGKEVSTLVNEKKQPGTYQVSFNADGLPSGIYFYQMKINDKIIQTRKMILLK